MARDSPEETRETTFVVRTMARDPDTGVEHEVEIRKDNLSGLMFGVDLIYLDGGWDTITDPYTGNATLKLKQPPH